MILTLRVFGEVVTFSLVDVLLLGIAIMLAHTWWRREDPLDWILDYVSNDRRRLALSKGDIVRVSVERRFRGLAVEIRTATDAYACEYKIYTHLEHERTAAVFAIAREIIAAERVTITVLDRVYMYDEVKPSVSTAKRARIEKIELSVPPPPDDHRDAGQQQHPHPHHQKAASSRQGPVIVA